jgi:methylated-DNA-[protein]-cysteine S-methyltransferase
MREVISIELPEKILTKTGIETLWFYTILEKGIAVKSGFTDGRLEEIIESEKAIQARKILTDYFSGKRTSFEEIDFKLDLSKFTTAILIEVARIPYGTVATYGEIAARIQSRAYRAVGQALKRNPLPVIIPCHRVVGKSGIGGYSSDLRIKTALLDLEGVLL